MVRNRRLDAVIGQGATAGERQAEPLRREDEMREELQIAAARIRKAKDHAMPSQYPKHHKAMVSAINAAQQALIKALALAGEDGPDDTRNEA